MWYKCKYCGAISNFNERSFHAVSQRCNNCRSTEAVFPISVAGDNFPESPYLYVFYETCHCCGEKKLCSSGTGSCIKCDDDRYTPLNHGEILLSEKLTVEEWDERSR